MREPHTISKKIGANNIGLDICDSCNTYFGVKDKSKKYPMSVELAFKEIFNVIRHLLPPNKLENKKMDSIYFNYFKNKRVFKIKKSFQFQREFISMFTRQFKRGVYEAFLQEYHRITNNGLDSKFNKIRDFARFDKGDIPLYFIDNDGAIATQVNDAPSFSINDKSIQQITDFGFYLLLFFGFWFFLEVTPRAEISREVFLRNIYRELNMPNPIFSGIKTLNYITNLDFTLRKLNS